MMRFKVYLAGPIGGMSYEDATNGWRAYATSLLTNYSTRIVPYSPMRFKGVLKDVDVLDQVEYDSTIATPHAIVARDSYDVRTSDLILVNLIGAKKVSIGTCCEIGMAMALNIPIVLAVEPDCTVHYGPFIQACTPFQTNNLEKAVELAASIILNR